MPKKKPEGEKSWMSPESSSRVDRALEAFNYIQAGKMTEEQAERYREDPEYAKSFAQSVKNSWESAKPVKLVSNKKSEFRDDFEDDGELPQEPERTIYDRNGNEILGPGEKDKPPEEPPVKQNLGGRNPKYDPKYADMMIEYFSKVLQMVAVDRTYYGNDGPGGKADIDGVKRGMVKKEQHKLLQTELPTLTHFALSIGVHRNTLDNWANAMYDKDYKDVKLRGTHKYPEFFDAYARAKDLQESHLVRGGLSGAFNSQMVMFILKNNHNYSDVSRVDLVTPGEGINQLSDEKQRALDNHFAKKLQAKNDSKKQ